MCTQEAEGRAIINLYNNSISEGVPLAFNNCGNAYADGIITKQNMPLASEYFKMGAQQGDRDCMYRMASLLTSGKVNRR